MIVASGQGFLRQQLVLHVGSIRVSLVELGYLGHMSLLEPELSLVAL